MVWLLAVILLSQVPPSQNPSEPQRVVVEKESSGINPWLASAVVGLAGAVAAMYRELRAATKNHEKDVRELTEKHEQTVTAMEKSETECRIRLVEHKQELFHLKVMMQQLSYKSESDPLTAGIVVDVMTGYISEWNPGASMMFHWMQREVFCKPIIMLVPPSYRDDFNKAFTEFRNQNRSPNKGPYNLWAMTKEGTIIPVEIVLTGWRVGTDQRYIGANITPRLVTEEEQDAINKENDIHAPKPSTTPGSTSR